MTALPRTFDPVDADPRAFRDALGRFATGVTDEFPKSVTIDLEMTQTINMVRLGVPEIGSTKKVQIAIGEDGKSWNVVGSHEFELGKAQRAVVGFDAVDARYVRLIYVDHYDQESGGFNNTFGFTSEVEVYHAAP